MSSVPGPFGSPREYDDRKSLQTAAAPAGEGEVADWWPLSEEASFWADRTLDGVGLW